MHIYFSGIGGVGIGPLALLALDAGHQVSGSDRSESDMTKLLEERGVSINLDQSTDKIEAINENSPIDWFVYTAALKSEHPELVFAKKHDIKSSKRADFLNELLNEMNLKMVAVSGTHGKTTTTGMLIWLFNKLEIPVSYSVGTTLKFGPPAQYKKGSEFFVYECDEFDRNFLEFEPELSLVTSLDYDHPDTYPSEHDYLNAFSQFAAQSKLTITWESISEKLTDEGRLFVIPEDRDFSQIKLAGLHNRQNAWLAATAINRLGLVKDDLTDWEDLLKKVSTFPGTNRRFEKLSDNIYTDYAHHPVEIKATIELAKELNEDVVIIYQPHQNVRQHELVAEKGYENCFEDVKKLYWLPTYLSREDSKLEVLTPEFLTKELPGDIDVEISQMNNDLAGKIKQHQKSGDLVIAMSAGDLDAWIRKLS